MLQFISLRVFDFVVLLTFFYKYCRKTVFLKFVDFNKIISHKFQKKNPVYWFNQNIDRI